jgi:hypothetical protein
MSPLRHRLILAAGLSAIATGLVGCGLASPDEGISAAAARPAIDWPIQVEYSLMFNNGIDPQHEVRVVWRAQSLLEWTTVQVCCGDHEVGTTMRVMADGRVFFGGYDGTPITYTSTHEPHDGMVPVPDFGPKYPTDLPGLQALDYITVLAHPDLDGPDAVQLDKLAFVADSLSLEPDDVLGYRIDAPWGYTERWVYEPLNLTLISDEYINGELVRHLVVNVLTSLDPTPDIPR